MGGSLWGWELVFASIRGRSLNSPRYSCLPGQREVDEEKRVNPLPPLPRLVAP